MRAGETVYRLIRVEDLGGTAVTGLTIANFTVTAKSVAYGGASFADWTHASALVDLGSGFYSLTYAAAPAAGWAHYRLIPTSASNVIVTPNEWSGEIEVNDLDILAALVAQGVATLSTTFQLGMQITGLEIVAYRARTLTIAVTDQAGLPVDLSGTYYTAWRIAIRDKTQQATKWECNDGKMTGLTITGTNAGVLTIVLPESIVGPVYETWSANRTWAKGDYVVPTASNGWIYQCTTAGLGAGVEPTWPTTEGNTVVENAATWTTRKKTIWTATTAKEVGDVISPKTNTGSVSLRSYWRCTTRGTTAGSEPAWTGGASPAVGATTTDGTVVWTYQSDWFLALPDPIAAANDAAQLYIEVVADQVNTSLTVPVIRSSTFNVTRREFES